MLMVSAIDAGRDYQPARRPTTSANFPEAAQSLVAGFVNVC